MAYPRVPHPRRLGGGSVGRMQAIREPRARACENRSSLAALRHQIGLAAGGIERSPRAQALERAFVHRIGASVRNRSLSRGVLTSDKGHYVKSACFKRSFTMTRRDEGGAGGGSGGRRR